MVARKDGIWETTQETAWALIALTDWMVVTGELQRAYDYDVWLNDSSLAEGSVTPDTIEPLLDRTIPGFGELYRMLSYGEIGSAALLSRGLAGLKEGRVVFALPGSRGAVRLAMEKLILPELGHLVAQAVKKR